MLPSNVIFSARYNFLKTFQNSSGTFSIAQTVSSLPTVVPLTTHGLGYIPRIKVWYEPVAGQLWPLVRDAYGDLSTGLVINGAARADSSILYADMFNNSPGTLNVTFYWRIYLDE